MQDDYDTSPRRPAPDLPEFANQALHIDVPYRAGELPDGRRVLIYGEPAGYGEVPHPPGDILPGFQAISGLKACARLLQRFGLGVSEWDLVHYALEHGWCATSEEARLTRGASPASLLQLVKDFGLPSHLDCGYSLEDLAHHIESGCSVCVMVNVGALYDTPEGFEIGDANYAVVVMSVVRDAAGGDLVGFYVHDALADKHEEFINAGRMQQAWIATGGCQIVTEIA